jgi:hypothetical protein
MRERVDAAKQPPGFVSVQPCIPVDASTSGSDRQVADACRREAWHESGIFAETRERMDRCEVQRKSSPSSSRRTKIRGVAIPAGAVRFGASSRQQRRGRPASRPYSVAR